MRVPACLRPLLMPLLLLIASMALPSASYARVAKQAPIAIGVNISNAPGYTEPMRNYVRLVHHRPALIMWYQQWSEPLFYSSQLPNVAALGALPVITWDPIFDGQGLSLRQIADGRYDAYIRTSARAAAAWKQPILIRFGHEMNLSGSPFGPGHPGDSPRQFIRAWRHVVRIFRAENATNVEWVWSPNVDCAGACPFNRYYPGNRWVDWVALDGYNYSDVDHIPWMSFDQVFGQSYRALTHLSDKPVMIGEMASAPMGGNKGDWITRAFETIRTRFRRIRAVVWFDRNKETNWTVNSSRGSLRAWRAVVGEQSFQGSASTLSSVAPVNRDVTSLPG